MFTADQLNRELDNTLWPRIDTFDSDASTAAIGMSVPEDLDYFRGHFPEQAVLPGVVQVHWAGEFAQRVFGLNGFSELKSVKFNSMLLPASQVTLTMSLNAETSEVRFKYVADDKAVSSGSLSFCKAE